MDTNEYNYEAVAYVDEELAQKLVDFLHYSEIIEARMEYDTFNDTYEVQVDTRNFKHADDLITVFMDNEDNTDNVDDGSTSDNDPAVDLTIYDNISDKYHDNLSSAYTFIICGVGGLIILLLEDFGIINLFSTVGSSNILFNIVVGGLFIAFIGIGIYSFKYSKKLKSKVSREEELSADIIVFLKDNLSVEDIEASYNNDIPDEMKFFSRIEKIKQVILSNNSELDEETLERISEKYYYELF